jgi:hypothetical protein
VTPNKKKIGMSYPSSLSFAKGFSPITYFLSLKSLQLRPTFLVLNIPTYCRDKSTKSLMNFIHPHEKTKYFSSEDIHPHEKTNYFFSEDIHPHEKTKYFFSEDIHPHEKTFIHMGRQMFHLHLELEQ